MKLLLLFGNAAVGKMTVGQELCKITPFRLFHNHMMIEPVLSVFGSFDYRIISRLRDVIFEEFGRTDNYGLVFTYMWAFNLQSDWDYVTHVINSLGVKPEDVYYTELVAPQELRLQRNRTENRLQNKASKRDMASSDARLIADDLRYRCESLPGEIPFPNYLRLDNSQLTAEEAAGRIKEHFGFADIP